MSSSGRGAGKEANAKSSAFLTEVKSQDNQKKAKKSSLSLSVRKDYAKLQDVVQHFAKKVSIA
jgi:hypothetical protein